MASRRPMGALEDEVMEYLWSVVEPATPAEVHEIVAPELAYTTVMTVLSRLYDKGRLDRERRGRAYAYRTVASKAEHRAEEMSASLTDAGDRAAVLSRFVDSLDNDDAKILRDLLRRGK